MLCQVVVPCTCRGHLGFISVSQVFFLVFISLSSQLPVQQRFSSLDAEAAKSSEADHTARGSSDPYASWHLCANQRHHNVQRAQRAKQQRPLLNAKMCRKHGGYLRTLHPNNHPSRTPNLCQIGRAVFFTRAYATIAMLTLHVAERWQGLCSWNSPFCFHSKMGSGPTPPPPCVLESSEFNEEFNTETPDPPHLDPQSAQNWANTKQGCWPWEGTPF